MKTIGIIGGFGPEATAQFYLKLVEDHRQAMNGQQPNIILQNVSVPKSLEHDALVLGKNVDKFIPFLTDAATSLNHAGADVIVLPCNTLHVHEEAIKKSIHLPFISIIDSSVNHPHKQRISRVGFMGSRITIQENLFQKRAQDITFVSIPESLQTHIDAGLERFVVSGSRASLKDALAKSFSFLSRAGIHDILVACTDFHGVCPTNSAIIQHDTVDILSHATIQRVLESNHPNMV